MSSYKNLKIEYYLKGVVWGDNQFVVVGYKGTILTSPDGINWTQRHADSTQNLHRVAWSGNQFVAVGSNNGSVLVSTDGMTWTSRQIMTGQLYGVAWGHNQFVAVGEYGAILVNRCEQPGFIRNTLSGKCIDVAGGPGTENGSPLILWDCEIFGTATDHSMTDQRWGVTPEGFIRNSLSGKCLDVVGGPGTANGAPLQLWDCEFSGANPDNQSVTDQKWSFTSEGFIRNTLSGKCIDVVGTPGTANGIPLQIWDCDLSGVNPNNPSNTDQKWVFVPDIPPRLSIQANGQSDFLSTSVNVPITLILSLDPGVLAGQTLDTWVKAETPFGIYYYSPDQSWQQIQPFRFCEVPLADLTNQIILKDYAIPAGDYRVIFAVDRNHDGVMDASYQQTIQVKTSP